MKPSRWALAALVLTACGDDDPVTTPEPLICPDTVRLHVELNRELPSVGDTVTLTLRVTDAAGAPLPRGRDAPEINPSYSTVVEAQTSPSTGVYTMRVRIDDVLLSASPRGIAGSCPSQPAPYTFTFAVGAGPADSVLLATDTVHLRAGERRQIVASASLGTKFSTSAITWTTDNPAVATVDAAGVVTGVAIGETALEASAGASGRATASVVVTGGTIDAPPDGVTPIDGTFDPTVGRGSRAIRPYMVVDGRGYPSLIAIAGGIASLATWTGSGFATQKLGAPLGLLGPSALGVDGDDHLWGLVHIADQRYGHLAAIDRPRAGDAGDVRVRRLDTQVTLGSGGPDAWPLESIFTDFMAYTVRGTPSGGAFILYGFVAESTADLAIDLKRCTRVIRLAKVTAESIDYEDVERFEFACGAATADPTATIPKALYEIGPYVIGLTEPADPDDKPMIVALTGEPPLDAILDQAPTYSYWADRIVRYRWDGARWDRLASARVIPSGFGSTARQGYLSLTVLPTPGADGEPRYFLQYARELSSIDRDTTFIWPSANIVSGFEGDTLYGSPNLQPRAADGTPHAPLILEANDAYWIGPEHIWTLAHISRRGVMHAPEDVGPFLYGETSGNPIHHAAYFASHDARSIHWVTTTEGNTDDFSYARMPLPEVATTETSDVIGRRITDDVLTGQAEDAPSVAPDGTRYLVSHDRADAPNGTGGDRRRLLRSDGPDRPWHEVFLFATNADGGGPAFEGAPQAVGTRLYALRERGYPDVIGNERAEVLASEDRGASWRTVQDVTVMGNPMALAVLPTGAAYLAIATPYRSGEPGSPFQWFGVALWYTPDVDETPMTLLDDTLPAGVPLSAQVNSPVPGTDSVGLVIDGDEVLLLASIQLIATREWRSLVRRYSATGTRIAEVLAARDFPILVESAALLPDGSMVVADYPAGTNDPVGVLHSTDLLATATRTVMGHDRYLATTRDVIQSAANPMAVLTDGRVVFAAAADAGPRQTQVYYRVSSDGVTWSDPTWILPRGGRGQCLAGIAAEPSGGFLAIIGDHGGITSPYLDIAPRDFVAVRVSPM